jgi:hypothetical protein
MPSISAFDFSNKMTRERTLPSSVIEHRDPHDVTVAGLAAPGFIVFLCPDLEQVSASFLYRESERRRVVSLMTAGFARTRQTSVPPVIGVGIRPFRRFRSTANKMGTRHFLTLNVRKYQRSSVFGPGRTGSLSFISFLPPHLSDQRGQ